MNIRAIRENQVAFAMVGLSTYVAPLSSHSEGEFRNDNIEKHCPQHVLLSYVGDEKVLFFSKLQQSFAPLGIVYFRPL